jgi:putative transferase (TIGR04331 family)
MKEIYFYKSKLNSNNFYCNRILKFHTSAQKERILEYNDLSQDFKNLEFSKKYQNFLFKRVIKKLNHVHNINYSNRLWKILLNRWVKFYVDAIILRYSYLIKNINESKIDTFYFKFNKKKIIPNTLSEFYKTITTEETDNYLSYRIATHLKKKYPKIKIFKAEKNREIIYKKNYINLISNVKHLTINTINFFLGFLLRKKTPVIVSSYFPRLIDLNLKKEKGGFFFWDSFFFIKNIKLTNLFIDKHILKRKKLFSIKENNNFENILLDLVDEFLPSFYLENFNEVNNYISKNLKKNDPKFIFTSNEFLFNEFFKFYTVKCIDEKKTKYYVGQHGSKYGCVVEQGKTIEEETADKFITWGWKYNKNNVPFGVIKTVQKKLYKQEEKIDKIIIVNANIPDNSKSYDERQRFYKNFGMVCEFLKKIDKKNYSKVIFRLHHADYKNNKFFTDNIQKISKKITIDYGTKSIFTLINSNNLLIFTYFSSGFLELLSMNKICFIFFDLHKKTYVKKFYKYFIQLKNKLFFYDPNLFANFINLLFENKKFYKNNLDDLDVKNFKTNYANYMSSIKSLDKIL